ncbi:MAG: YraN family protein [Candidatus Aminicenantes bacterium]|nr:YraN family protein [Candidatus Aminicenantes bacterium]
MENPRPNRVALGRLGETAAVRFLEKKGWSVLVRGFRWRRGEIDIIARDGETLVFVEVKTRTDLEHGPPEAAVTFAKRRQVRRVAAAYLAVNGLEASACRFDVLAVEFDPAGRPVVRHLTDAF